MKMGKKKSVTGNIAFALILLLFCLFCVYPILSAMAISLNDAQDSARGGVTIYPRVPTLQNYTMVLTDFRIPRALLVSVARTVLGTLLSLLVTGLFAYGMSKKYLMFKKLYMVLCIISMYFSGGLIPYYLLIKNLGFFNNFLVYLIPGAVSVFNMIIMRTFFRQLPDALEESAYIDGAGPYRIFFTIIVPLSTPIFATIAVFVSVSQWNSWLDATLFMTKSRTLLPMQNILMEIINSSSFYSEMLQKAGGAAGNLSKNMARVSSRSIRMAVMIITIIPIVCSYPFLQKYFIKGVMIGSIKG